MIRTETIEREVLGILGHRQMHGYEIHKELESRDMKIGIGRLYDILNQMYSRGLLKDAWSDSASGPKRRVYWLTKKGEQARNQILEDAIHTVHEYYGDYLRNLPTEKSAFALIAKKIVENSPEESVIGFLAERATGAIKTSLKFLRNRRPKATIYFVGSRKMANELDIEGLPNLEGSYSSIPTKDQYLDLIVLPGFLGVQNDESCYKEWRRVLKPSGKIAIAAPTALIRKIEDPLSIGEFIEQREYPPQFNGDIPPEKILTENLKKYFAQIESYDIVHITILTATGMP
ncbi:MAG: helix-turn-helix transcriptional regulator [Candidatus Thorarchaeota archaeon]